MEPEADTTALRSAMRAVPAMRDAATAAAALRPAAGMRARAAMRTAAGLRAVPAMRDAAVMRAALLAWWDANGRRLRFRATRDPWAVLVSEVMLQQTGVARVQPAWDAFISTYPAPADLAAVPVGGALRAWAGLGYNRRALSLHRAAQVIVERHAGRVPGSVAELEALPGIGQYTARAVAAIAFGQPVAAVDTNVRRVVGRVFEPDASPSRVGGSGAQPLSSHARAMSGPVEPQRLADGLVDPDRPGDWTHAAMDLGATICRPRNPDCVMCPIRSWCAHGRQVASSVAAGAHRDGPARRAAIPSSLPFPLTTRWLRGRIIARLREAQDGAWVHVHGPIGDHAADAVAGAIDALLRDGLVERCPNGDVRLPSAAQ